MPADEMRDASDAMLVVSIGRYRQEALAEAYRRHAGAVFALSRRLLVDRNLAEEVVQEVFLRLWHRPEKFDPDRGSLRSFLLAQTHGRSVDILRSEVSRRQRGGPNGTALRTRGTARWPRWPRPGSMRSRCSSPDLPPTLS